MTDYDRGVLRLQIAVIYAQAQLNAMQEVLASLTPQVQGQSLDSWLDRRHGELVYESLCRIETPDPAYAAILQGEIDQITERLLRYKQ